MLLSACVSAGDAPAPSPTPATRPEANAPPASTEAETRTPDAESHVERLLADYENAHDAYVAPYREAKSDEERSKLAPLRWEDDPVLVFRPRFEELAAQARGEEAGLTALLWIFEHRSRDLGGGREQALRALAEITARHATSPRLERLAQRLQYDRWVLPREAVIKSLRTLIATNPHPSVRGAAMLSLANIYSGGWPPEEAEVTNVAGAVPQEWDEAGALLRSAVKECAGTPWSDRAAGLLREREGLQIGMTAPDFEAVDGEGKAFRLTDFRGKVVVLDFWSFG